MHEMQAQCPHGTIAVSLAQARQTGHCMERAASVVGGRAEDGPGLEILM